MINGKYVKKKYPDGKDLSEYNWVWSPQGAVNMHMPERWGYLQFSDKEVGGEQSSFILPYSELQRQYLWLVYYKQMEYKQQKGYFAQTLNDLKIEDSPIIDGKKNKLSIEALSNQFSAVIEDGRTKPIRINQEGYISNY